MASLCEPQMTCGVHFATLFQSCGTARHDTGAKVNASYGEVRVVLALIGGKSKTVSIEDKRKINIVFKRPQS